MAVKAGQVKDLNKQAEYLQRTGAAEPEKMDEIVVKKSRVEERFQQLKQPLLERQRQLEKKKEAFQFGRDVEDEKLWIAEKIPQASSNEVGTSLFNVLMLKKKNQSLRTEIENHEPRIVHVCNNGQKLVDEGHEDAAHFQRLIDELQQKYRELKELVDAREHKLTQSERVQQVSWNILKILNL